jgi:hypothetical protein
MIGLLSMRREIRGRDGRVFRLDFNVQSDHMSAVYQFFALAVDVVKFDLRRRCGDLWDGSGLPHFVDPSLECVPDSLFLVDAVLETMVRTPTKDPQNEAAQTRPTGPRSDASSRI